MRKPYVILIGSASGIGKSTVASELARELNIKHLIETDFIREIVRGIIGPDYALALYKSSFDAYTTLRDKERFRDNNIESLICAGFEEHASFVIPAVEKVIERAVADSDDVAIEGVHLLPGLLDIEKFEENASIHFFVLSAEENVHKERFVKRAMEVKRGGKHLEYFRENRVIHDYLVRKAREHEVPVINNDDIRCTIKRMLSFIRENCAEVTLQHPVERLGEVIDIIIKRHGGRIVDVSYPIPGFSQPLKRDVNVYDPVEAERFLKRLNESPKRKRDLERLYTLSDNIHSHRICAPDPESLQAILNELEERGLIYREEN
ncbi:3H domain-containing protein [Methanothermobacter sp. K4]|uniref:3H domain-containing protein n=1 Tax=Methanothermobacter sp. K4 TaxID=2913262 RepID=UPI001EDAA96B|nr:3H domain-containing protein [Methanothermobacter sp. K4]MCG2829327.1 AAA family ATPase [Methanothermobacter sp. K4]